MLASYRVFTDTEIDDAAINADFAKKKARRVHFEDEPCVDRGIAAAAVGSVKSGDPVNAAEAVGRGERVLYFAR